MSESKVEKMTYGEALKKAKNSEDILSEVIGTILVDDDFVGQATSGWSEIEEDYIDEIVNELAPELQKDFVKWVSEKKFVFDGATKARGLEEQLSEDLEKAAKKFIEIVWDKYAEKAQKMVDDELKNEYGGEWEDGEEKDLEESRRHGKNTMIRETKMIKRRTLREETGRERLAAMRHNAGQKTRRELRDVKKSESELDAFLNRDGNAKAIDDFVKRMLAAADEEILDDFEDYDDIVRPDDHVAPNSSFEAVVGKNKASIEYEEDTLRDVMTCGIDYTVDDGLSLYVSNYAAPHVFVALPDGKSDWIEPSNGYGVFDEEDTKAGMRLLAKAYLMSGTKMSFRDWLDSILMDFTNRVLPALSSKVDEILSQKLDELEG